MVIEKLVVGQLFTNCYFYCDEKTKKCFIIDPGDDADYILQKIRDLKLKPQAILVTHAHFDHLLAVVELKLILGIPFFLHKKDLFLLKRMTKTAYFFLKKEKLFPALPDYYLFEGKKLKIGETILEVLETPGHTPGGVTFFDKKNIFSGDLIFKGGNWGRTDFEGGSESLIKKSIKKILSLPPKSIIYPGHGEKTSVAKEKKYFKGWLK